MDTSWAATTCRTVISLELAVRCCSIPVLIALKVSCPLSDYSIGEYPLQIFSSYTHNCFSGSPCIVIVTFELSSSCLHYSSFHHYYISVTLPLVLLLVWLIFRDSSSFHYSFFISPRTVLISFWVVGCNDRHFSREIGMHLMLHL